MTHTKKITVALGQIAALVALTAGIAISCPSHGAAQTSDAIHGARTEHPRSAPITPAVSTASSASNAQTSSGKRRGGFQQVDYSRSQIIARLRYIYRKLAELEPVAQNAGSMARR